MTQTTILAASATESNEGLRTTIAVTLCLNFREDGCSNGSKLARMATNKAKNHNLNEDSQRRLVKGHESQLGRGIHKDNWSLG